MSDFTTKKDHINLLNISALQKFTKKIYNFRVIVMKNDYLRKGQKKSWRGEAGTPASSQKGKFINLLFNKVQLSVQRKGYTKKLGCCVVVKK